MRTPEQYENDSRERMPTARAEAFLHPPLSEALDVERLAESLAVIWPTPGWGPEPFRDKAAVIAAEYARRTRRGSTDD